MNDALLLSAPAEIVERIPLFLRDHGILSKSAAPFENSLLSLDCFQYTGKVFIGVESDGDKVCIFLLPESRSLFRQNPDAIELRNELERILRENGANEDFPPEHARR